MERMSGIPDEKADLDAWYGLAILFIAYTVSFIDRTILSLLVEPIKTSLDVSDTQISLLHGLAFAIFYTLLGIPIARLADRHSRKYIISVGIFVWSMMTAVCGLADRFTTLFLARVGVGVGEAALSPAAYSMLADMFPKKKAWISAQPLLCWCLCRCWPCFYNWRPLGPDGPRHGAYYVAVDWPYRGLAPDFLHYRFTRCAHCFTHVDSTRASAA